MRGAAGKLLERGEPVLRCLGILIEHLGKGTRYVLRQREERGFLPGANVGAPIISCGADPAVASAPTPRAPLRRPDVRAWRTQIAFPTPPPAGRTHSRRTVLPHRRWPAPGA